MFGKGDTESSIREQRRKLAQEYTSEGMEEAFLDAFCLVSQTKFLRFRWFQGFGCLSYRLGCGANNSKCKSSTGKHKSGGIFRLNRELTGMQVNDIGACFCDLTSNACDVNCCCDSDCTEQDKAAFTGCLPESPETPQLTYCISKSAVQSVNLGSSGSLAVVYKNEPKKDFFSELLCIEKDNNPAYGNFFMDPGDGNNDILTDVMTRNPYAQFEVSTTDSQQTLSFGTTFVANDTIPIAYFSSAANNTLFTPKYASLVLPSAILGDQCQDIEVVGFLHNVPSDSRQEYTFCIRHSDNLAQLCQSDSVLSPTYYIDSLRIASTPASSSFLSINVSSVASMTYSTGEITQSSSNAIPGISYDSNSGICSNVIQSLKYVLKHNSNGALTGVDAEVILTNVESRSDGSNSYNQRFKVEFVNEDVEATVREKSGNPGYRNKYPILAGVASTDSESSKVAISQFTEGLPYFSSNTEGLCSPHHTKTVSFDAMSMNSCKMMLSLEQLRKYCSKDATAFDTVAIPGQCPSQLSNAFTANVNDPIPLQLTSGLFGSTDNEGTYAGNTTYVGIWGDADPSNTEDWQEVQVETADDSMTWNEDTLTCSSVVTGIKYEFLTSKVGSQSNPQSKVSFARVKFIYDDWTFKNPLSSDCPQAFHVHSTVSFVETDQEVDEKVTPPSPPIFPRLPKDAFYPFLTT